MPPLLATKLSPPATPRVPLPRTRLDARLEQGVRGSLTLVSAPAGWGKTTLVADWARRTDRRVGWVGLDERDRDPRRLLAYLVAAFERAAPGLPLDALGPIDELELETAAITLLNALAEDGAEAVVVLDDAHLLEGAEVHDLLRLLVERAPAGLHLVLTTRVDPPLPLSRLRARGQLTEIRADELRFCGAEVGALLEHVAGVRLEPAVLARLEARTEGWAVGLQMSALSLRGHDDAAQLVQHLSDSPRFVLDYLIDEVLGRMSAERRRQLLELSILTELSASVVAAVTGVPDGHVVLDALRAENLFVVELDARTLRFHRLFGTLLRHELELGTTAEHRRALHRRASEAYLAAHDAPRAIDHALQAEAWELAARLVLERSEASIIRSDLRAALEDLERFPEAVLEAQPALLVRKAWIVDTMGSSLSRPLMQRARLALQARPDRLAEMELDLLEGIGCFEHDRARARAALERAAAGLEPRAGTLRGILHVNEALLEVAEDRLEPAQRAVERLLEVVVAGHDPFAILWARWYEAHLMLLAGSPGRTIERLLALQAPLRERFGDRPPRSTAMGMVTLAHAHMERGELDDATHWLDEAQALVDPKVAPADAGELVLTWALLEAYRDPEGAGWSRALARGEALAATYERRGYRPRLEAVRLRILLHARVCDDPRPAARAWLDTPGVADDSHPLFTAVPAASTRPDFARLLRGRALVRLGEHSRAAADLTAATARAEAAGRRLCATEGRLALAELAERMSDGGARDEHLQRAIAHAAPERLVAPFLEHDPRLLTRAIALATHASAGPLRACLAELVGPTRAKDPAAAPTSHEPLSARELEVLALVARGMSNAEVGRSLFVAPSTVKKHLENVYGKLDVRRRTQAVARARALGALP